MEQSVDFAWITGREGITLNLKVGEKVFQAGDPVDDMYVVRSGTVEIRADGKVLERVEANGIFGEMALIDSAPRSAEAVIVEDAEILPIDRRLFMFLVHETPCFALDVMSVLANRLRAMNQKL
jgi:CRP-like cAMP-binding protein